MNRNLNRRIHPIAEADGLSPKKLRNAVGTVDDLYRGEVSAIFYHVFTDMPRYRVGDRIGQIKLGITLPLEFEEVDELGETARGDGGYGSTGR